MLTQHDKLELDRIQAGIKVKKDRISRLQRLAKLGKSEDLLAEYDDIIRTAEDTIWSLLNSKEHMDPQKEQVILRSTAQVRLMAKGLKTCIGDSDRQIDILNNKIAEDNQRIAELTNETKPHRRVIA